MNTLNKGILWAGGCLAFVFALSIGLSWYTFGYLDTHTVALMVAMMFPLLGGFVWIVLGESDRHRAAGSSWFPAQAAERKQKLEISAHRKVR